MKRLIGLYYNERLKIFFVLSFASLISFILLEKSIAMAFIASCIIFESLLLFFANCWILPEEKRKKYFSVFTVLLAVLFCCASLTNSMFGHEFSGRLAFFSFSVVALCSCSVRLVRKIFSL